MHYYSPIGGFEAISIIVGPRGAFTCQSSTQAVVADSDPFRGQLLTVLAFTWRSSTLAVFADSDLIRGLLLNVLGSHSYFHD